MILKNHLFIFFILIGSIVRSQDPQFTQFYANSLYLNPALAGKDLSPRFHSGYRNQWPEMKNAYVTYNLEYDDFIEKIHGGLGLQFLHDKTANGLLNTSMIAVCYAYQLKLSKGWSVNFALKGAFQQKSFNQNLALYPDMIDEIRGFVYSSNQTIFNPVSGYFDAGSGLVVFSPKSFFGIAVNHLTRPQESFIVEGYSSNRLPIRYTIHGGRQFKVLSNGLFHKALFISPNVLFDLQTNYKQLNFGSYFRDGVLAFGVWFRSAGLFDPDLDQFTWQNAIVLMGGVETDKMRIGYSYDLNMSKLIQSSLGSHEISITFDLPTKEKKIDKYRVIYCPMF